MALKMGRCPPPNILAKKLMLPSSAETQTSSRRFHQQLYARHEEEAQHGIARLLQPSWWSRAGSILQPLMPLLHPPFPATPRLERAHRDAELSGQVAGGGFASQVFIAHIFPESGRSEGWIGAAHLSSR